MASTGTAANSTALLNPDGSLNYGNLINSLGQVGSSVAGGVTANNSAAAQITGTANATTNTNAGNTAVQGIYQPQQQLGNSAFTQLGSALGLPGSTPLSSNFLSQIPGLTQAENQGQTAAQNMISAGGNLYNSGTPGLVGNYISSQIALPAYQNYVQNLLSTANLGNQANQGLAGAQMQTTANLANESQTMGNENASGVAGVGGAVTNGINSLFGGTGTGGSSGSGAAGSIVNQLLSLLKGGGSSSGGSSSAPVSQYDQYGNYIGAGSSNYGGAASTPSTDPTSPNYDPLATPSNAYTSPATDGSNPYATTTTPDYSGVGSLNYGSGSDANIGDLNLDPLGP